MICMSRVPKASALFFTCPLFPDWLISAWGSGSPLALGISFPIWAKSEQVITHIF
ncbi:asr3881 [Nostoc sp. PCC 7120 = FACHB-418]|nr:asr3881 [Nostoc sp. PCC 7120 = FACHB-418]